MRGETGIEHIVNSPKARNTPIIPLLIPTLQDIVLYKQHTRHSCLSPPAIPFPTKQSRDLGASGLYLASLNHPPGHSAPAHPPGPLCPHRTYTHPTSYLPACTVPSLYFPGCTSSNLLGRPHFLMLPCFAQDCLPMSGTPTPMLP